MQHNAVEQGIWQVHQRGACPGCSSSVLKITPGLDLVEASNAMGRLHISKQLSYWMMTHRSHKVCCFACIG